MKWSKRKSWFLLMMFTFLVLAVGSSEATYVIGPDPISDNPAVPHVFSKSADGYGYSLSIQANPVPDFEWHVPLFLITNTSTNAHADILSFTITIGDTGYNFDHLGVTGRDALGAFSTDLNSDGVFSSSTPDNQDGAVREDFLSYSGFSGFDIGDAFTFMADIDIDGAVYPGSVEDFRTIFNNNGATTPNTEVTVVFSTLPEPATLCLLAVGAGLMRLRRRRA